MNVQTITHIKGILLRTTGKIPNSRIGSADDLGERIVISPLPMTKPQCGVTVSSIENVHLLER